MANKRMYSKDVTDSDAFIEMSSAAQALYFHLNQGADDDGFNNQIQLAMLKAHASTDDLKILLAKSFVIRFESGVIVIKHWRMHNTLRKDRYVPTNYQEEFQMLGIKENGAYTLDCHVVANGLPDGCRSIGKVSKVESSIEEKSIEGEAAPPPPTPAKPVRKAYGQFRWVKLSDEEYSRLLNDLGEAEVKRCIAYVDESAQTTGNKNKWRDWNLVVRKCSRNGWGKNQYRGNASGGEDNPFLGMLGGGYG